MIPYHNVRTLVYVIPLYVYISHNSFIRIEHVLSNDTQLFTQNEICTRPYEVSLSRMLNDILILDQH